MSHINHIFSAKILPLAFTPDPVVHLSTIAACLWPMPETTNCHIIAGSIHIKPNAITDVSIDEVGDKNSCPRQQRPHLFQSDRVQHIISSETYVSSINCPPHSCCMSPLTLLLCQPNTAMRYEMQTNLTLRGSGIEDSIHWISWSTEKMWKSEMHYSK